MEAIKYFMVMAVQRLDEAWEKPADFPIEIKFHGTLQHFIPVFTSQEDAEEWIGDRPFGIVEIESGEAGD